MSKKKKTTQQAAEENMAAFLEKGPGIRATTSIYVVQKDTVNKLVLLGGLGGMGVGQMWSEYTDPSQYADYPGWEDAPDKIAVTISKKDPKNGKVLLTYPTGLKSKTFWADIEEKHLLSPSWDTASVCNIYEESAVQNRLKISEYLSNFLGKSDAEKTQEHIEKFLDAAFTGSPTPLELPSLPVGVISNILANMGYYLGNMQHAGSQLAEEIDS